MATENEAKIKISINIYIYICMVDGQLTSKLDLSLYLLLE
jgi:hypothetical protein